MENEMETTVMGLYIGFRALELISTLASLDAEA